MRLSCPLSDARTGSTIEDRVRPVLETGTAVGGRKPVLVVIDEIDGATGGMDNVWCEKAILYTITDLALERRICSQTNLANF